MESTNGFNRKEMEKEARKRDILDMAATLFASRGYHEVKVDEIAEGVGLSKGTIYLYFENKEKLFFSILFERLKELNQRLSQAIHREGTFDLRLKGFIGTYLDFFKENEAIYKIVHSEKTRMSMETHYQFHAHWQQASLDMFALITQLVEEGAEAGRLRPLPPATMALTLLGILNMVIYDWVYQGTAVREANDVDLVFDLYLNGAKK